MSTAFETLSSTNIYWF